MQPVSKLAAEKFHELPLFDRFGDKTIHPNLIAQQHICLCVFCRKGHDRNITRGGMNTQFAQHRQPVQLWKLHIQQDNMRHRLFSCDTFAQPIQRGNATPHHRQIEPRAGFGCGAARHACRQRIILNQQCITALPCLTRSCFHRYLSMWFATRGDHYSLAFTQTGTEVNAVARCSGCVPPACAMSALPPPLPPTCCATKFTSSPALTLPV